MRNHGNFIVSVSELGRFLAEQAEALGAVVLPETAATKLLVEHGRVVGVRTGDRGRGREGEPLPTFEPGNDVVAGLTVLAEGTQGYLTGAAIDQFGLHGENPQIWALGVKEVWRVREAAAEDHPHDGLAAADVGRASASSAARSSTRWATTSSRSASSPGSSRRTSSSRCTTSCRSSRRTGSIWKILGGGERVAWGAKTITEGGYYSLPSRFNAPGLLLVGEGAGLVNVPRLKGVHYAIESGRLAAEAAFRALQRGEVPSRVGALDSYDESLRASKHMEGAARGAQHAPGVRQGLLHGRCARERDDRHEGPCSERPLPDASERGGAAEEDRAGRRAIRRPTASTSSTSSRPSSRRATARATTSRTTSRCATTVRRPVAEAWEWMCPAHVYEVGRDIGDGMVTVEITPSNCVQCGAITAKGGRLTPPEGGSGPEYTLT